MSTRGSSGDASARRSGSRSGGGTRPGSGDRRPRPAGAGPDPAGPDISHLSAEAQRRIREMQAIEWGAEDEAFARSKDTGSAVSRGGPARAAEERDSLTDVPDGVRLQKVLAAAGVGSRRDCEEMIGAGRVQVDGHTVRRFGARVDPETQIIRVDGKRIPARQDVVYLAFNKPPRVLTAMSDDRGRSTITDFLGDRAERLFHVGRLDYDTEGLMILTNDGELAHRLAHPSYEVAKTYLADVPGPVPKSLGQVLTRGVELDDGVAVADKFRVIEQSGNRALVEITLHEGRKHIVRRMLAEAGHPVSRLVRTDVGPVRLGNLRPGTTRDLTTREIGELYAAVRL
jgi:23S rRNA pseudouridine2605 synthase